MDGKTSDAPAWRVIWQERTPSGRYFQRERLEYAESQSLAVNQALAKIRQSNPAGVIVRCERVLL